MLCAMLASANAAHMRLAVDAVGPFWLLALGFALALGRRCLDLFAGAGVVDGADRTSCLCVGVDLGVLLLVGASSPTSAVACPLR
jgi:hypothetical protein